MFNASLIIARAVHIGACILVAGIFTFEIVVLGTAAVRKRASLRDIDCRLFRLALWTLVGAFASAVLWLWLEVINMSGLPFSNAFTANAWQPVMFQTNFGRIWAFRLCLIAVTFAFASFWMARDRVRRDSQILWLLSVVVLISLAWISHAAAAPVQPLGVLGDALHLCAAGGWIGGLVPLTIFLVHTAESTSFDEGMLLALERFSTLSVCCVAVLVISGICNNWLLVGSVRELFATVYGRLLLIKLALFAILVGIGARNRFAIKSKRFRIQNGSNPLSRLRRNVIFEVCLGATVIAIVACLGVTPPAHHP